MGTYRPKNCSANHESKSKAHSRSKSSGEYSFHSHVNREATYIDHSRVEEIERPSPQKTVFNQPLGRSFSPPKRELGTWTPDSESTVSPRQEIPFQTPEEFCYDHNRNSGCILPTVESPRLVPKNAYTPLLDSTNQMFIEEVPTSHLIWSFGTDLQKPSPITRSATLGEAKQLREEFPTIGESAPQSHNDISLSPDYLWHSIQKNQSNASSSSTFSILPDYLRYIINLRSFP